MQNKKIIYENKKIGSTEDYSMFKYYERNRKITKNQVDFLRQDMHKNGQMEEVVINEKNFVINGQHRIAALALDKKKVKFSIKKGATMKDVIATNSTPKNWNSSAWLNSWSHKDHFNSDSYLQFINFKKNYGFAETICKALLSEDFHDYGRKSFVSGDFKIKSVERSNENADKLSELIAVEGKLNKLKACLAYLKLKTLKDFSFSVFKEQLEKNKKRIANCNNVEHWIDAFIDVYNFNLRKPKKKLTNRHIH